MHVVRAWPPSRLISWPEPCPHCSGAGTGPSRGRPPAREPARHDRAHHHPTHVVSSLDEPPPSTSRRHHGCLSRAPGASPAARGSRARSTKPWRTFQMHHETSGLGRVLAQHRGRWLVALAGEEPRLLPARAALRADPPVTGDRVAIDEGGAISAVLERRGTLVRRAPGAATGSQVLAA